MNRIILILSLSLQSQVFTKYTLWNSNVTCTSAGEKTECQEFLSDSSACCATITVKTATSTNSYNKCYSRYFAALMPTQTIGTTTVTYQCLNSNPSGWYNWPSCNSENNCAVDYCCATFNVTMMGVTKDTTNKYCVLNQKYLGQLQQVYFSTPISSSTADFQGSCLRALNPRNYAEAAKASYFTNFISITLTMSVLHYLIG
ncbi:UNKNOWN [Stylonychia lemnae]|uniref:Uncharacterized protein n=1 Tax=Stylonychia lemnae TaxID=5949 RepID=A0A078B3Z8_STYLE|nr:UNKNOWN [Stylonychia lemnae]|eukprot:CDW88238.1 UNKNOWN [Stylonychia lemnae]